MNHNLTEFVFILDRSGSMAGLEQDTIGGYNALLNKQREEPGDVTLTTVLFDDRYELLHDRMNLRDVSDLTARDYYVRGSTALLDALGETIQRIGRSLAATPEEKRPGKVLFVVTTDGMENASHKFSLGQVRHMIRHQQETYAWEFLFLGANIDAVETARGLGIQKDRAVNYHADSTGTEVSYGAVCAAAIRVRRNEELTSAWKCEIEKDYEERN